MKLLIVDRGYIDSDLIGKIKQDHGVDTLVPLRSNMGDHHESVDIACLKGEWSTLEEKRDPSRFLLCKKEIAPAHDLNMWEGLDIPLHGCTTSYTVWDPQKEKYDECYAVLVSTKKYQQVSMMVRHYDLRMQTEERFRQFKHAWYINEFPSPHASLVESHVCFTLFTYSLMQMYLRRKDLREKTNKMIATLRRDERMGKDAVLVYAAAQYGVFDLDDYTVRVAGLEETPRERLIRIMSAQKEARIKRES